MIYKHVVVIVAELKETVPRLRHTYNIMIHRSIADNQSMQCCIMS